MGSKFLRPNLGKQVFITVRDETGREPKDSGRISEVERFYKELYSWKKDATVSAQECIWKRIMNLNSEPLTKIEFEMQVALSQLKNNKVSNADGIWAELYKGGMPT